MPFPRKFQYLLDLRPADVELPDYAWLVYGVCGVEQDSCGWAGWVIEAVFQRDGRLHPTGTGDKLLSADDGLQCPKCGRDLFRTESVRMEPSADQKPPHGYPGIDYEVAPMEYED